MQYVLWHAHVNNDAPKKQGDHAVASKQFASANASCKKEAEADLLMTFHYKPTLTRSWNDTFAQSNVELGTCPLQFVTKRS